MASNTKQTETIRERKMRTRGRARKNKLNKEGTTLTREELFRVQK